ncbi:MAG: type II toxin-antitoxin system HipA family toxin [Treponema sp.]|nr:type II toxin-antitoxin system HipA family toxin [Treponema sp.]
MSTLAEVRLWGSTIGSVLLNDGDSCASFEYDPSFAKGGVSVAPLAMPLSSRIYRFPGLARESFHGLPGMLADSLPDKFGNALIDVWLARQGRRPESFNAVERLCYTGKRGMGALEFYPLLDQGFPADKRLEISRLVELASRILRDREGFRGSLGRAHPAASKAGDESREMAQILQVGTSAGGARAKAVIAWNPETGEVRSGQADAGAGFQHWIIKFDGVAGNRDKEPADPLGYTNIEYAYSIMAVTAGIVMSECRLFSEGGRNHFMTRRFDRGNGGDKIHMSTLGGLAHYDFNSAGAYGYEEVFPIIRRLDMPPGDMEQFFRRMAFNIAARNQDDHVKNIAFLMDRRGRWRLSPAYDVTYSFQKDGLWTSQHQMSMNGKRDGFTLNDFIRCGKTAGLIRGRAAEIVREVREALEQWPDFASRAGVSEKRATEIEQTFRIF